jgi:hypothetical protein
MKKEAALHGEALGYAIDSGSTSQYTRGLPVYIHVAMLERNLQLHQFRLLQVPQTMAVGGTGWYENPAVAG